MAFTLVTDKDKEFVGHLVRNLEGANQEVPDDLMELAMQSSWFRSSRFKGGKGKTVNIGGKGLGFKDRSFAGGSGGGGGGGGGSYSFQPKVCFYLFVSWGENHRWRVLGVDNWQGCKVSRTWHWSTIIHEKCFQAAIPKPGISKLNNYWPNFYGLLTSNLNKIVCIFCFVFQFKASADQSWNQNLTISGEESQASGSSGGGGDKKKKSRWQWIQISKDFVLVV